MGRARPAYGRDVRALFGKAGPVENQHPRPLGHHLAQARPHRVGVPPRVRNEVLETIGRMNGLLLT
jgi:hypothetical protein